MGIKGLGMRASNEGTRWWGTGLRGRGLSVIGAEGHRLRARHGEALPPTEPTEEKGKKKPKSFAWFCFFEIARCGDRKRGRREAGRRSPVPAGPAAVGSEKEPGRERSRLAVVTTDRSRRLCFQACVQRETQQHCRTGAGKRAWMKKSYSPFTIRF